MAEVMTLNVCEIACAESISSKGTQNILHQHFNIKNFPQNGCRVFLLLTKNEIVRCFSKTARSSFGGIQDFRRRCFNTAEKRTGQTRVASGKSATRKAQTDIQQELMMTVWFFSINNLRRLFGEG